MVMSIVRVRGGIVFAAILAALAAPAAAQTTTESSGPVVECFDKARGTVNRMLATED